MTTAELQYHKKWHELRFKQDTALMGAHAAIDAVVSMKVDRKNADIYKYVIECMDQYKAAKSEQDAMVYPEEIDT